MLNRILVATDGSEHAHKAVLMGSEIAARFGAGLVLVHVLVEDPSEQELSGMAQLMRGLGPRQVAPLHMDELIELMATRPGSRAIRSHRDALREIGGHVLERASETARGQGAEVLKRHVLGGEPAETIVGAATSEQADLVVMGTRGLGGLRGRLLGTVSQSVTRHAPVSCLTVR